MSLVDGGIMRKISKLSINPCKAQSPTLLVAALVALGGGFGVGVLPACSNAMKMSSTSGVKYVVAGAVGQIDFKTLSLANVALDGEVVALSFTESNKALILMNNRSSIALDTSQASGGPVLLNPTPQPNDADAKIYPIGKQEYWALSPQKVALIVTKTDGGEVVSRASVDFGGEPEVLSVSRTAVLLRVGSVYKILRLAGKFEFSYDGPLDFKGRSSPLTKIVGAGLVGDSGFWVSDGERIVSVIVRKIDQEPEIISQKIKQSGLGDASHVAFHVVQKEAKLQLEGSALAYRTKEKVLLSSGSIGGQTTNSDAIGDAVVVDLIKNNCSGCHLDTAANGFKGALKVSSWKASADKIKMHLEANSMPPGGTQVETRQKLGQFLKSVSGVDVNIVVPTSTPMPSATPDQTKITEFNNTYRTLIRSTCVNGCHDHVFDEANDVTFDEVKRRAIGMKQRLDNNSMPRAPITISATNRTLLSNWLGSLNP